MKRRDMLIKSSLVAFFLVVTRYVADFLGIRAAWLFDLPEIKLDPAIAQMPDPSGLNLRFAIIADTGWGDSAQYGVAQAMTRYYQQYPYPLVLLAGDNIYRNGEMWKIGPVFERPYRALLNAKVSFRACLGNHDIRTNNGDGQVNYPLFNMAGRYYTFREKNVQFFMLDTNNNADWQTQLRWLETELQQSDAPWKVVCGHYPVYSCGRYGNTPRLLKTLTPLLEKYGVQLYVNGHEHNYQRSKVIRGVTYLVAGNGGAPLYPVQLQNWVAYTAARHGFTVVEVFDDRLQIQAIGADGDVFDHTTLQLAERRSPETSAAG